MSSGSFRISYPPLEAHEIQVPLCPLVAGSTHSTATPQSCRWGYRWLGHRMAADAEGTVRYPSGENKKPISVIGFLLC